ncbi:MAG: lipid-A-disaccharide synthase [Alphaproteobacteria bacterium]|jgi:lipid-A-disaccharide synthase|nr:lipid-A-disaccharide synthase [Alphaproteobacteria bacterium]MBT4085757.1 lipid-A-disaccharide synthase [Alphaproteobacteria bacterium]MBT4543336.1 lipid-A-disaccharide synthase [Alphaproteobacteria bacterium]MBT7747102.1 lipid-A-disaccharide synthase [Alphaproteobacteria bacterium]
MGKRIMLVAGEASGDALGGPLMAALTEQSSEQPEFIGVGGSAMTAEGMASLFPISDLSVMGLAEILPRLRLIFRRMKQTETLARETRPDIIITIDSPGFNFRLGKRLKYLGIPLVHYVAPTVWAWKPGRAKKIAQFLDHLLVLLPFEPPYFEIEGLDCTFVGHSAVSHLPGDGPAFRDRHDISESAIVLGVLPGSRQGEVSRLLPEFLETAEQLNSEIDDLVVVVPAVDHVSAVIKQGFDGKSLRSVVVGADEKRDAFAAMNGALAASGTVTLELTLAGVPTVAAYRMNALTMMIVKRMTRVSSVSLTNLVLGQEIIPEYLQQHCTAANLVPAVRQILMDTGERTKQIEAAAEVASALGAGGKPPAQRAAEAILKILEPE